MGNSSGKPAGPLRPKIITNADGQSSFPSEWDHQAEHDQYAQELTDLMGFKRNGDTKNLASDSSPLPYDMNYSRNSLESAVRSFKANVWIFFDAKIKETDGKFYVNQRPVYTVTSSGITQNSVNVPTQLFKNSWQIVTTKIKDAFKNAVEKATALGVTETAKLVGSYILGKAKEVQDWIKKNPKTTAATIIPLLALALTPLILHILGFAATGIAAGSAAAAIQAIIGNVAAGSLFATCTSAMMGGAGALIILGGVWACSTAVVVVYQEKEMLLIIMAYGIYLVKRWWRDRSARGHEHDD